ncbi:ferredoxin III, nif-specific [Desulfurispira natronophila]|uniref:Ferredoxin III n=1 Tax=Desulfurispira natronophila TaxID=682562 RepID=A0A7W7Y3W8_9BACT|nr:ferredoxin III, nif-specific [Desulfurispira natronophila]MBB5021610.1 Nif-specific ferredoxin III [Desulfurispira natronophila]
MSTYIEGYRKDGTIWIPEFIVSLASEVCIGCGRCFKACTQGVLNLMEEEDEDDDDSRMFMSVVCEGQCIGCKACAAACPKSCFEHAPMEK